MSSTPMVSVILPVFNGEDFLASAIESILNQTYASLELIAINDGSTDQTLSILQEYANQDPRIRVISRENRGLVRTLNEGLELARGKYIARMDADDISFPTRLEQQVDYMEQNTDVVLLGVSVVKSMHFRLRFPELTGKKLSTWMLMLRNNIGHPGVLLRSETVRQHNLRYKEEYLYAEDFKLWNEIVKHGNSDIIKESLLFYRVHPKSISRSFQKKQAEIDRKIVLENIRERFFVDLTESFFMDFRSWVVTATSAILGSPRYKSLEQEDKKAVNLALLDYGSGFGFRTYLHAIKSIGLISFISTGTRAPITCYRSIKRQINKEWLRMEL